MDEVTFSEHGIVFTELSYSELSKAPALLPPWKGTSTKGRTNDGTHAHRTEATYLLIFHAFQSPLPCPSSLHKPIKKKVDPSLSFISFFICVNTVVGLVGVREDFFLFFSFFFPFFFGNRCWVVLSYAFCLLSHSFSKKERGKKRKNNPRHTRIHINGAHPNRKRTKRRPANVLNSC